MLIAIALILGGGTLLYFGGEWLVSGSSSFALRRGFSKLTVGLTIVAFGTSAPELFISSLAAIRDHTTIAIGNVIGSNIANIGLILGVAALVYPPQVSNLSVKFQVPFAIIVTILFGSLALTGELGRLDALILLIAFGIFIFYCLRTSKDNLADENRHEYSLLSSAAKEYLFIMLGLIGLAGGSELFVRGAVKIAILLHVSEFYIGLSLVALGTSLPELATSIIAATKKESEIVIGNIIGSCIFNILLVIGVVGLLKPIPQPSVSFIFDLAVMLGLTVLLYPVLSTGRKLSRFEGLILLAIYAGYIIYITIRG